jgi:hypothetical protein
MLDQELRDAIRNDELSIRQTCIRSRIDDATMYRFLKGSRTLTLPVAGRICDVLGLHLVKNNDKKGGE